MKLSIITSVLLIFSASLSFGIFPSDNSKYQAIVEMNSYKSYSPQSAISHGPIYINDARPTHNWDSFPNKTGSGTEVDPYLIQNLEILAGSANSGITILNSSVYAIFYNCSISNYGSNNETGGLILKNCQNIQVNQCQITSNSGVGVVIEASYRIMLNQSIVENNLLGGVFIIDSFQILLENCQVSDIEFQSIVDFDGDGLLNEDEANIYMTDPYHIDSDGDGLTDGEEVVLTFTDPLNPDTDGDGMHDGWEYVYGLNPNNGDDGSNDPDSDNLVNFQEFLFNTNPNLNDCDFDGLLDGFEVLISLTNPLLNDTDRDGMPDGWEVDNNLDPLVQDAFNDKDQDNLINKQEYELGTHPYNADTDGDGWDDAAEMFAREPTNPLDPDDYPKWFVMWYSWVGIFGVIIIGLVILGIFGIRFLTRKKTRTVKNQISDHLTQVVQEKPALSDEITDLQKYMETVFKKVDTGRI